MWFLKLLLCISIVGISYRRTSIVEWTFDIRDAQGVSAGEVVFAPLWAPPKMPSYAHMTKLFRDLHPEYTPRPTIYREVSGWLPYELMLSTGVLNLLIGLLYLPWRRLRPDLMLDVALCTGIVLTGFVVVNMFIWGILPYWIGLGLAVGVAIRVVASRRSHLAKMSSAVRG